jgi:EPS-associated MarR family transcriptional regulator
MKLSEKAFQVLDALDKYEISTQRQLADHSGISLGQVNYILKSLLERGLVKVGNFRRNPSKIGYAYLLTPKGIEEKSRLAFRFVIRKLKEYDILKIRLTERLIDFEQKGLKRFVFIGPSIVKDFIDSIIKEKNLDLISAGHHEDLRGLKQGRQVPYDSLLLFDGSDDSIREIKEGLDIPEEKLISLW